MHHRLTSEGSPWGVSNGDSAGNTSALAGVGNNDLSLCARLKAVGVQRCDLNASLHAVGPIVPAFQKYFAHSDPDAGKASRVMIDIRVTDPAGRPVFGAEVIYLNGTADAGDMQRTDTGGRAVLSIKPQSNPRDDRLIIEAPGSWGLRLDRPTLQPVTPTMALSNTVVLNPISRPAIDSPCWGQEAMQLDMSPQCTELGLAPVRVAIITCQPLAGPASGFSVHPIAIESDSDAPVRLAGPKAASRNKAMTDPFSQALATVVATSAPGALIDRIFLPRKACVADLVHALDQCLRSRVDIVCLSLSGPNKNGALGHTLRLARASGLAILAPAGDVAGAINAIAETDHVLGVAALGALSVIPKISPHFRLMAPGGRCAYAPLSGAARGAGINLIAPGIAVMPMQDALSGTALAAAYATGFLARLLQASPAIQRLPRGDRRVTLLQTMLLQSCVDCGVGGPSVQGAGLPVWGAKGRSRLCSREEQALEADAQRALDRMAAPRV